MLSKEEKARLDSENARLKKAQAEQAEILEDDQKVFVEFRNMEDPPREGVPSPPFSFDFGGKKYTLKDGEQRNLPISVVTHLNSLQVPLYGRETDPVTGQVRVKVTGKKNRFSLVAMAEPRKKPGPKKQKVAA